MSDNEDLLGDDLGDHSLADYNLGNEEEEQLLADDYDSNTSQNVPTSVVPGYSGSGELDATAYPGHSLEYGTQSMPYVPVAEECVVPNITVEVPNTPLPDHSTYAPYEPPPYENEHAVVPPAIPAAPIESPQIVPSDIPAPIANGEQMHSERGAPRLPQVRDIPDSLDKVYIPRSGYQRGPRTSWRNPHYQHPYRRNYVHRGNFNQRERPSFPPPQVRPNFSQMRPEIRHDIRPDIRQEMRPDIRQEMRPDIRQEIRPDIRQEMRPDIRQEIRPDIRPDMRPDMRPEIRPDIRMEPMQMPPQMGPEISPERPILPDMPFRQENRFPPPRFPNQFRPNLDEPRPNFGPNIRPNFEPRPFFRPGFPRPFVREISPNNVSHMPQVTLRQPVLPAPKEKFPPKREPEVIMLPVQLPPNLPPGGLAGKKVLINPHFKGNFQPPVDGLPTYIPTRIQKSPPLSPTLESKFGPIKDIDDAAERFIAEQRNALARAANRKRRSPQRYIENTTIEIENDLMGGAPKRDSELDLLRRQEEFIHANREGLRRRMRSPSPVRRSPSPRRSPDRDRAERERDRRHRPEATTRPHDEDSEYRRRVREQETLRERVLRAKELRRRKNAVALQKQIDEKERDRQEKAKEGPKPEQTNTRTDKLSEQDNKPQTTTNTPVNIPVKSEIDAVVKSEKEEIRERSPIRTAAEKSEVNSTFENLTPPRDKMPKKGSPERALTPPLPLALPLPPAPALDSDDDLDLILGDIDGILSDDDDTGRFKAKADKSESAPAPAPAADLRSKLAPRPPPRRPARRAPRQKIVFQENCGKEKTPPRRALVTSSTKTDDSEKAEKKSTKIKPKTDENTNKSRQRIIFESKEAEKDKDDDKKPSFSNRRVILQRKIQAKEKSVFSRIEIKTNPSEPNPGIFSRAVRTAIGGEKSRIVVKKQEDPQIDFESESDVDEDKLLNEEVGMIAVVKNLPHGMTDTRLNTLAGSQVQSLNLDKEDRSAKITFKTTIAAENFKKKFNNKMVAASRLTVTLR